MSIINQIGFSIKERRTILVLLIMAVIIQSMAHLMTPRSIVLETSTDQWVMLKDTTSALNVESKSNVTRKMPSDGDEKLSYPTIKIPNKELPVEILLMDFDPNTTDSLEWIKLGFKPFAVRNILKYISKGGRFKNCQDLKKIYGIDTNFVEKILPHCKIENTNGKNEAVKSSDKLSEKININLADSLALKSLYGIGPKLSKRIVKYRDNLGGFHDIMQLKEVYGITDEVIANNINTLDASGPLRKININTSDFEAMSHHYYFDYKTSRLIINYRNQHGNFDSLTHLKKIKLLPDSIFEKIKPYCSIE